ncbi:MAG: hypothetical protein GWO87_03570, partial [Xanthomonadaceae bacterium]|nr:hypothetical protein [Rhodospirillaceae bacterium]NIA18240.1 hypothetical protein [Xanthomonadaceae bacterium]
MNKFFAQNKIEKILNKVLTNNSLNVLYNMSNSCDFLVKQCLGKDKKRYILKIMKRKSDVLRQQFINEIFINIFLGKSFFKNFPYQVVDYNIEKGEEFFLYEMIEGRTLNGYYF